MKNLGIQIGTTEVNFNRPQKWKGESQAMKTQWKKWIHLSRKILNLKKKELKTFRHKISRKSGYY